MVRIGPVTGGMCRALPGGIVAAFLFCSGPLLSGCHAAAGRRTTVDDKVTTKSPRIRVCNVEVAVVEKAVLGTRWHRDAMRTLGRLRLRAQRMLDDMTARYRKRYGLDIRAAEHLKKERELERLRGAVISEEEYKRRRGKLAALLDAEPSLKRAVEEQRTGAMAYRVRKQSALMEATKIALAGRKLEKQLADTARDLDEHARGMLAAALRSVASRALAGKRCDLVCAGSNLVGARRPRRGTCKMRATMSLTREVVDAMVSSLGGRGNVADGRTVRRGGTARGEPGISPRVPTGRKGSRGGGERR